MPAHALSSPPSFPTLIHRPNSVKLDRGLRDFHPLSSVKTGGWGVEGEPQTEAGFPPNGRLQSVLNHTTNHLRVHIPGNP